MFDGDMAGVEAVDFSSPLDRSRVPQTHHCPELAVGSAIDAVPSRYHVAIVAIYRRIRGN